MHSSVVPGSKSCEPCMFPNIRLKGQQVLGLTAFQAVVPRGVTIPPDSISGGSERPLVACRGTSTSTYHCPAPEEAYGLIRVPSAECECAECIGRLVLEPLQELVET